MTHFELLKYAATGIASPEMTAYDKMRAVAMGGGGAIKTLTGVPPLTFKANGKPLISWSMLGNGAQNGTPSPDNVIMPEFVGVRTRNLFDAATVYGNMYDSATGVLAGEASTLTFLKNKFDSSMVGVPITISVHADDVPVTRVYIRCTIGGTNIDSNAIANNKTGTMTVTVTPTSVNDDWRITFGTGTGELTLSSIMLNSGSAPLPYEPYGWAEKITCAGQTVPIYLGQVSTARRIRKLIFDGTENWRQFSDGNIYIALSPNQGVAWVRVLSTHFTSSQIRTNGSLLWFVNANVDFDTVEECKTYLAQQYAAGTPVTAWYVLSTPETGIVNEPLCKISDYADELHSEDAGVSIPTVKGQNTLTVDTELQPSSMTITYR